MSLPRLQWTDDNRIVRVEDCRLDAAFDRAPIGSVASFSIENTDTQTVKTGYMDSDELAAFHAWAGTMLKQKTGAAARRSRVPV